MTDPVLMLSDVAWSAVWRHTVTVLVWVLFVSSLAQATGHFLTAWVAAHQESATALGPALVKREASLGVKAVYRAGFEAVLVAAVTWNAEVRDNRALLLIFLPLIVTALVALWYMARYVIVLRNAYWSHVDAQDARDARQDARQAAQNTRERAQNSRDLESAD